MKPARTFLKFLIVEFGKPLCSFKKLNIRSVESIGAGLDELFCLNDLGIGLKLLRLIRNEPSLASNEIPALLPNILDLINLDELISISVPILLFGFGAIFDSEEESKFDVD